MLSAVAYLVVMVTQLGRALNAGSVEQVDDLAVEVTLSVLGEFTSTPRIEVTGVVITNARIDPPSALSYFFLAKIGPIHEG